MDFEFVIEDVFSISGRGTVVTGRSSSGAIRVGDPITIKRPGRTELTTIITGIEMFRERLEELPTGEEAGLLLRGIRKSDLRRGDVLFAEGAPEPRPDPDADTDPQIDPPEDPTDTIALDHIQLGLGAAEAPALFLPLRLETAVTETGLRVRAFPDALHGGDARVGFSPDEKAAGEAWVATPTAALRKELEAQFGIARAYAIRTAATAGRLSVGNPNASRPLAHDLPDRLIFTVRFSGKDTPVVAQGAPIPRDLPIGPGAGDRALFDGPNDPLFWMADFDTAVAMGMAAELPFPGGRPPTDSADVTVLGLSDGDSSRMVERLAHGPGLTALNPGQATKGDGAGSPLGPLPPRAPHALSEILGAPLPDTLENARSADAISEALLVVLWEAALRPALARHGLFGEDLGLTNSVRALSDLREALVSLVPVVGEVPVLQVGRSPIGVLQVSTTPSRAAPDWLGKITEAIRGSLDALVPAALAARDAHTDPAEKLVDALARTPFGKAWRVRQRWHGTTILPLMMGALDAQDPLTPAARSALGEAANNAKSAREKAQTFRLTDARGNAAFAEYVGMPFADLVCGPLVAKDAEMDTDTRLEDPVIESLLSSPDYAEDLLSDRAARRDAEGPDPLLRVLSEDAMQAILADLAALDQSDGDPGRALELRHAFTEIRRAGDGTAHRLMVDLLRDLGEAAGAAFDTRRLNRFARAQDGTRLVKSLSLLQGAPRAVLHLVLATLIDTFSTRADLWIEAEARLQIRSAQTSKRCIGAWGHVEAVPLGQTVPRDVAAAWLAAPSMRLARLQALLWRAQTGLDAEGLRGAIDMGLSADRVQAARIILEQMAAVGRFDVAVAQIIAADLRRANQADLLTQLAELLPDPEGAPRFDALTLLERGESAVPGLDSGGKAALKAAIDKARDAADALGALLLADAGLALSEGRADRAAGLLAARSAGGVVPPEPEAMQPRPSGTALQFSVAVTGNPAHSANHPAQMMAPALADLAARLVGPLDGTIVLTTLSDPGASRSLALSTLPGGALALVRLAAADRATLPGIGDALALATGLEPSGWRAKADPVAADTIWAGERTAQVLAEGRSLTPDDFTDAVPTIDTGALQGRIAEIRATLTELRDRANAILPSVAIIGNNPILTNPTLPGGLIPDVLLDPQPAPTIPDIGFFARATPTSTLLADLLTTGILLSVRDGADMELLRRAVQAITTRLDNAESAATPEATLGILLGDLPVALPLRLPADATWTAPSPDVATVADWLETSGHVRPRLEPLCDLALASEADLWALQWGRPVQEGQVDWIGGPMIEDDAYAAETSTVFHGHRPGSNGTLEGLILDSWSEVVPDRSETIGIAAQADAPSARAPNVILVAPAPVSGWTPSAILKVIDTSMGLAKLRSLTLTDLPSEKEAGILYGDLGAILPRLSTDNDTGLWRALCDPVERRL